MEHNYDKVQLISNPRWGSTYAYELLRIWHAEMYVNSYKNSYYHCEPFLIDQSTSFKNCHDEIVSAAQKILTKPYGVVKNHSRQIDVIMNIPYGSSFNAKFKAHYSFNVVLIRLNLFDTVMSLLYSSATDQYTVYDSAKIELQVTEMQPKLDYLIAGINSLLRNAEGYEYHNIVYYEDLHPDDHDYNLNLLLNSECNRIEDFRTNVEHAPSKSDVILNYDELYEYFINDAIIESDFFTMDGTSIVINHINKGKK